MKSKHVVITILLMMSLFCKSQPNQTVSYVDLHKYMGTWFEIASYPASFQKGCHCSTAEYELSPNGKFVYVTNRCIRIKGTRTKMSVARAKAFPVKNSSNSKLKVQFFWPFKGDYYIIGLAEDYSWAIVGHPKRKYCWILSRDAFLTSDTYRLVLEIVSEKGYNTDRVVKTPQNCDEVK